jgi:hypothetical protein
MRRRKGKFLARVLTVLLLIGLAAAIFMATLVLRAWWLRHQLLGAIESARSIEVIEHSSQFDSVESMNDPNYRDVVYGRVSLSPSNIAALEKALSLSCDFSGLMDRKCIFQDHHDIYFQQNDSSVPVLHLCFHCGQLKWNDHYQIMPEGWDSSLAEFVSSLGLHPKGPWTDDNGKPTSPKNRGHR